MSRRILQPGEIEALDNTTFPRVLPPHIGSLFLERAARLRQLASGNPIADYLEFAAHIVSAQHQAAQARCPRPPRPQRHATRPGARHAAVCPQPSKWTPACTTGSRRWSHPEHPGQPDHWPAPALQPLIAELRHCQRRAQRHCPAAAQRSLWRPADIGMAPFIMAALQVRLRQLASRLARGRHAPTHDPATICPSAPANPVASVCASAAQARATATCTAAAAAPNGTWCA